MQMIRTLQQTLHSSMRAVATRTLRYVQAVRKSHCFKPLGVLYIGSRNACIKFPVEDGQRRFKGEVMCCVPAWQSSLNSEEALFAREVSREDVCYNHRQYRPLRTYDDGE